MKNKFDEYSIKKLCIGYTKPSGNCSRQTAKEGYVPYDKFNYLKIKYDSVSKIHRKNSMWYLILPNCNSLINRI
jgi:hypothetical protein